MLEGRVDRFLALVLAVAALLAVAASAPAGSAAAASPLLPDCGNPLYGGKVSPVAWSSGCNAGSVNLDGLSWQGWGAPTAVGAGIVRYNTCDPDCASGDVSDYPATLTVDSLRRCASPLGAQRYYTRFTTVVTYPEDNAAGEPAGPAAPFTFSANCPTAGYLVGTRGSAARFGAFEQGDDYDGLRLEMYFGPASSSKGDRHSCVKRWRNLGLRVQLALYGTGGNACSQGIFIRAVLTGRRWHTKAGVRPGTGARHAARSRTRRCSGFKCGGKRGYIYGLHRSECAAGRWPNVVAETARGRVKRLVVYSHSCE